MSIDESLGGSRTDSGIDLEGQSKSPGGPSEEPGNFVSNRTGARTAGRACVAPPPRLLVASMKLRDGEMQRIATIVLGRLEKTGMMRIVANRAALEQRIVGALRANIRAE